MKNILKLSLLISAIAASGINASVIKFKEGHEIVVPNRIIVRNNLKIPVTVDGRLIAPGAQTELSSKDIAAMVDSDGVQTRPKVAVPNGRAEYLSFPRLDKWVMMLGTDPVVMETDDVLTYNVSEILDYVKDKHGFNKPAQ